MAKYYFSNNQFNEIKGLLKRRLYETRDQQKTTRGRIRKLGFNISDYFNGFTDQDFQDLLDSGIIKIVNNLKTMPIEQRLVDSNKTFLEIKSFKKESLPSISDSDTEILILGTMPGDNSLANQQYYNNSKNQFWKIIFAIFNNEIPVENYDNRIELLKKHKIGLWDVLKTCNREGSSDSAIVNPIPNDFKEFFDNHTRIKTLIFNGKGSFTYYKQFIKLNFGKSLIQLNSTSSLNSHKNIDQKIEEWGRNLKSDAM
ncbi:MAG: DNA-deoxyinosine glycosylase [Bacteroidales bacterium]|nr:DNA-deoxyinosine glycosylase [Bacteroidales bacterium]